VNTPAHQPALQTVVASVPRLALTQTEAARALGVSVDFLQEHVWTELRIVRRGRKGLVAVAELERWLERNAARTLENR
jgi:excisionase family DNA binding protein